MSGMVWARVLEILARHGVEEPCCQEILALQRQLEFQNTGASAGEERAEQSAGEGEPVRSVEDGVVLGPASSLEGVGEPAPAAVDPTVFTDTTWFESLIQDAKQLCSCPRKGTGVSGTTVVVPSSHLGKTGNGLGACVPPGEVASEPVERGEETLSESVLPGSDRWGTDFSVSAKARAEVTRQPPPVNLPQMDRAAAPEETSTLASQSAVRERMVGGGAHDQDERRPHGDLPSLSSGTRMANHGPAQDTLDDSGDDVDRGSIRPVVDPFKDTRTITAAEEIPKGAHGFEPPLPEDEPEGALPPVPGYHHLGELGRGAMGEVHEFQDLTLNRRVALKVILRRLHSRTSRERFSDEAQIMAQLQHPGIVGVHSLGYLSDGRAYFTMDLIRGRELQEVIDELQEAASADEWLPSEGGWTLLRLLDVLKRVCETVGYAHSRGAIHRDLKPKNIMLGRYGEVLVVDWGLAKLLGSSKVPREIAIPIEAEPLFDGQRTAAGGAVGTPAYMAPEQAHRSGDEIGPSADVYALGMILYQLLSGSSQMSKSRWDKLRNGEAVEPLPKPGSRSIPEESRAFLKNKYPPIPADIVEICAKAMALKPAERYPDAEVMAAALENWLDGRKRRKLALEAMQQATHRQALIREQRVTAASLREGAERALAVIPTGASVEKKLPSWREEDQASDLELKAVVEETRLIQSINEALTHVPDLREAHAFLADFYQRRHQEAELAHRQKAAAGLEELLRAHDTGRHAAYLARQSYLTLDTAPSGTTVFLHRYELFERRLVEGDARCLGRAPLVDVPIEAGSYLLRLVSPGAPEVRFPVWVKRDEHWHHTRPGGNEVPVRLPTQASLEEGDVFVPAGMFRMGGDPEESVSLPGQDVWVEDFVIKRHPVSVGEYLGFLNELVGQGRGEEALAAAPRDRVVKEQARDAIIFGRGEDGHFVLRPDTDGDVWGEDWPMILLSWEQCWKYTIWMAERTGLPWRLPFELEWEKAARGVDGRRYPWGDFFDDTWSKLSGSPGKELPCPMGDFLVDVSPYGVRHMAGNAINHCADVFAKIGPVIRDGCASLSTQGMDSRAYVQAQHTVKGGGWSQFRFAARLTRRSPLKYDRRDYTFGFRMVRSLTDSDFSSI